MNIRTFQLSDHYPLNELLQSMLSEECYDDTYHALINQLSWDCELVLLAEIDRKIVGVIVGTIENNHGYYYRIAVESSYRQQGIGKSLFEALKRKFHQRKVTKIFVTLDVHNETLIPFYQAHGYEKADFSRTPQRLSIVNHA
jgi:ribosomal protein S18 acetylase RimI-like enzyme